jgi:uncharacterized membrane protein (DUF4010 family)
MTNLQVLFRFAAALVIGILIGLQREFEFEHEDENKELPAGIRTFAFLGLTGAVSAMLSDLMQSPLPFVVNLLIVGAFFSISHVYDVHHHQPGLTTKVASLLTVLIGALCYQNRIPLAVALGVVVTFLLSFKLELHGFVHRITREDIYATLKFALVCAVILPVLPNRTFGSVPFNVLNPFKIWLLVAFISGLSFVGYILIKTIGPKRGIGLTGFFGGLASSTALTASFTERSREDRPLSKSLAFAIMIAWSVMFFRILVLVTVLNRNLLHHVLIPVTVSMVAGLAYSVVLYRMETRTQKKEDVNFTNPFELSMALKFALIFTLILLVSKVVQLRYGNAGFLFSSFVLGLADVDAIVLSVAKLSAEPQGLDGNTAVQAIVLAAAANTFLKAGIVAVGGSAQLRRLVLPGFVLIVVCGVTAVFVF